MSRSSDEDLGRLWDVCQTGAVKDTTRMGIPGPQGLRRGERFTASTVWRLGQAHGSDTQQSINIPGFVGHVPRAGMQ